MNGRLERMDSRMELFSEASYQHIAWELREERIRTWKKRIWRGCLLILWPALAVVLWRYR